MSRPTVLVADDFEPMATAMAAWLGRWYDVVGCVHRFGDVLDAVAHHRPAVVVLDLAFKLDSALALLPALTAMTAPPRVLIHTAYREYAAMTAALAAGAAGFVVKSSDFTELHVAIETALAGGVHRSPTVHPERPRRVSGGEAIPRPESLPTPTPYEASILAMLASGHSVRQIAVIVGRHHSHVSQVLHDLWRRVGVEGPLDRRRLASWYGTGRAAS